MLTGLIGLVVWIIVVGIIIWLLIYLIDQLPFIEPPFKQVARTLILVIGVLILIVILLNFLGLVGTPIVGTLP